MYRYIVEKWIEHGKSTGYPDIVGGCDDPRPAKG
jgi:hypothetical protein